MTRHDFAHLTRRSTVAIVGLGALAVTACRPAAANGPVPPAPAASLAQAPAIAGAAAAPVAASTPAGTPVAVNCGAGQQALIRPLMIDGQLVSQVDCVAVPGHDRGGIVAPSSRAAAAPELASMDDDPRVAAPTYRRNSRPAGYRTAEYEPEYREPVQRKSGRTWQKSAIIIGSSAGVGAGVGAAVGGKKGALIGAAIGGGSATIWDQVTRRK
jgi:hypothetical protein